MKKVRESRLSYCLPWVFVGVVALLICACIILATNKSCEKKNPPVHEHEYTVNTVEATCVSKGLKFYFC